MVSLRGTHNVDEEMEEMRVEARKSMGVTNFTIKQLVTSPALKLPIIIACLLQITQQWSGINAVSPLCSGPQAPTLSPTLMHSPLSHSHLLINLDLHPFITQLPSQQS